MPRVAYLEGPSQPFPPSGIEPRMHELEVRHVLRGRVLRLVQEDDFRDQEGTPEAAWIPIAMRGRVIRRSRRKTLESPETSFRRSSRSAGSPSARCARISWIGG